jgi:hypothetical protein
MYMRFLFSNIQFLPPLFEPPYDTIPGNIAGALTVRPLLRGGDCAAGGAAGVVDVGITGTMIAGTTLGTADGVTARASVYCGPAVPLERTVASGYRVALLSEIILRSSLLTLRGESVNWIDETL